MTHDASRTQPPAASGRFDAIIVPASRGATALDGAAHLSAQLGVPLVALCSKDTGVAEAAVRVARTRGCVALVVDVPSGYQHDRLPTRTAARRFLGARAGRRSDLSLKRNLGLLMARLHGWGKILFLDDDICESVDGDRIAIPTASAHRLAAELDVRQIAGLTCHEFPDNSVACHARRLAGFRQDTFVSGAALAVNCNDLPVPLFPDQYNEDWFFFSRLVAERELALAGTAMQAPYDPFADPNRARQEEFGDLLAEGLFTLFEQQAAEVNYFMRLDAADEYYWQRYIEARWQTLSITKLRLEILVHRVHDTDRYVAALRSLDAAHAQLYQLSPAICADYVDAWAGDLREWERYTQRIRTVRAMKDVLNELDLSSWDVVGGVIGAGPLCGAVPQSD